MASLINSLPPTPNGYGGTFEQRKDTYRSSALYLPCLETCYLHGKLVESKLWFVF